MTTNIIAIGISIALHPLNRGLEVDVQGSSVILLLRKRLPILELFVICPWDYSIAFLFDIFIQCTEYSFARLCGPPDQKKPENESRCVRLFQANISGEERLRTQIEIRIKSKGCHLYLTSTTVYFILVSIDAHLARIHGNDFLL